MEKAGYETSPLEDSSFEGFNIVESPITSLTRESLKDSGLDGKGIGRCKNMFALGIVYWLFNRPMESTESFLKKKFKSKPDVVNANIKVATMKTKFEGDVFNIGNGDNRSVNEIADMIGGERIHRDPVVEPQETLAHNGKAKFILDWKPTTKIEEWMVKYKEEIGL